LGCINIHGSILPKYRGASPVQRAVLNGDKETGVTSMYISEEMDAGDMLLFKRTGIDENETSAGLYERLGVLGSELLSETVDAINQGTAVRIPQNQKEATYAPLLTKDMSPIDWAKKAHEIKCKVRGLIPWPVASMEIDGKIIKVFDVDITADNAGKRPGTIISDGKPKLEVACADGCIIVKEIQAPNGKKMSAAEYLRGNPLRSSQV